VTDQAAAERFNRAFGPSCWAIDDATHDGDALTIRGWALPPEGRQQDIVFTANGRPFDDQRFPLDRGDLVELFWYRANAKESGFECRIRLTPEELRGPSVTLHITDRASGQPFDATHAYIMPTPASVDRGLPLPDAPRMLRTTGNENATNFRLTGLSTAVKLREVVAALGRDFSSLGNVLDWGCGCGRIARFCSGWPGFSGVDIDADNAQWCHDHLPPGRFGGIGLFPPTPLPDHHFDLIFGISVMTHLAEDVQQQWLAELHRISAPYGIVLLTTLGEHAAVRAGFSREAFASFVSTGSIFLRTTEAIDDALGNPGYYGTTFMTHDDIRRKWSRWFSVDRIIPAYVGNHQDMVVLRRR
jgi:SAM-dependent methyltransferase